MRKDINIDINSRDIQFQYTDIPTFQNSFSWINNPTGLSRYIYGEITLPHTVPAQSLLDSGLVVNIPYTPLYKEFYVRFKRELIDGYYDYIQNPKTGGEWFLVVRPEDDGTIPVFASELLLISLGTLNFRYLEGEMVVYNGQVTDLDIIPAYNQNTNLLLICAPANHYRYPISGVNIQKWLNGNVNKQDYLERLKEEFYKDGVIVNNAVYSESENKLYLDTNAQSI